MSKSSRRFIQFAAASIALAFTPAIQAEFKFEQGDRVAIIGNATAGRLQYDSWLETFLQTALPKHELVIRNLAFPGDTVDKRPRNKGFMAAEDYLKHVAADVIFVFFGGVCRVVEYCRLEYNRFSTKNFGY